MKTSSLSRFDGGHAEDSRTTTTNECETCDNFDVFSNPHLLKPYIDTVAETMTSGTTTDYALTDVDSIIASGTVSLVALGRTSSGVNTPAFFRKDSSSDITSGWQYYASGVNSVVSSSLVVYKGFAYCLGDSATAHNLQKFDGSAVATIGTLTNTNYSTKVPRPFVHPEDNVLYFADGNIIGKYDGSSFTASAFTGLPSDKVIVSLTNYGAYLVIVCRPKNGVGNSTMYFWGRDTGLNTVQESIDLGSSQVNIVENIDNQLIVISTQNVIGNYSNIRQNRLIAKVYAGGALQPVKEILLSSSFGTALNTIKVKKDDKVYFGFSDDTSIYVFGKNKLGSWFLSHNRGLPTGTTTLTNFSIVGDFIFVAFNTAAQSNQFRRTLALSETVAYTATSTYRTTINPSMPLLDRGHMKKLHGIQIFTTDAASGTLTVKYSVDGSSFTTCGTQNNATGTYVIECLTENGSPFKDGREYQFQIESTGGLQIKEIRYRYELVNQAV